MLRRQRRSTLFPYTTLFRSQLTGGYLRPNGVPFSERATVKEFFNTFTLPGDAGAWLVVTTRSEEHTSELQSHVNLVCRLLLEKKKLFVPFVIVMLLNDVERD